MENSLSSKRAIRQIVTTMFDQIVNAESDLKRDAEITKMVDALDIIISGALATAVIGTLSLVKKDVLDTISSGMDKNIELVASKFKEAPNGR